MTGNLYINRHYAHIYRAKHTHTHTRSRFTNKELALALLCPTVLFIAHAQNDLWGSVVPRHHIRSHHEAGPGGPRQPKVQNLQRAVRLHHDIARFQILQCSERKLAKVKERDTRSLVSASAQSTAP